MRSSMCICGRHDPVPIRDCVNEFAFRWNTRKLTDVERMGMAVPLITGKRLTRHQVI